MAMGMRRGHKRIILGLQLKPREGGLGQLNKQWILCQSNTRGGEWVERQVLGLWELGVLLWPLLLLVFLLISSIFFL